MNLTQTALLKKENLELIMVVCLSMVLLFVLKTRFFKTTQEIPRAPEQGYTHKRPPSSSPNRMRAASKSRAHSSPANLMGRIQAHLPESPALLTRDIFSPLNPVYNRQESGNGGNRNATVLNAIIMDTKNPLAIINNEVVGIGDIFRGGKVMSISKDDVVLSYGNMTKTLTMNEEESHE